MKKKLASVLSLIGGVEVREDESLKVIIQGLAFIAGTLTLVILSGWSV